MKECRSFWFDRHGSIEFLSKRNPSDMKSISLSIPVLVFFLLANTVVFGQWEASSNGMQADVAYCFIEAPDGSILVGTSNGIYRSMNSGTDWSYSSNGLAANDSLVLSLAANGNRIFAAINESVYYSDDNGGNWTFSQLFGWAVNDISSVGGLVFAVSGGLLFQSLDNGLSWTYLNNTPWDITSSVVRSGDLIIGTYSSGILFSSDFGQSWNYVNNQWTGARVQALASSPTRAYAGISIPFGDVLAHKNINGQFWSIVNSPDLPAPGTVDVKAIGTWDTNVLISLEDEILLSYDDGASWSPFMTGFTATAPYGIACFDETTDYIFCGVEGGGAGPVFRVAKNQIPNSVGALTDQEYATVSPNPVTGGQLTLNFSFTNDFENCEWRVFDSFGRCVYQQSIVTSSGQATIPTPMAAGVYHSVLTVDGVRVSEQSIVVID